MKESVNGGDGEAPALLVSSSSAGSVVLVETFTDALFSVLGVVGVLGGELSIVGCKLAILRSGGGAVLLALVSPPSFSSSTSFVSGLPRVGGRNVSSSSSCRPLRKLEDLLARFSLKSEILRRLSDLP